MGSYGRLLSYVAEIKKEIAFKVFLNLLISVTYIAQAFIMAAAVSNVFAGNGAEIISWLLVLAVVTIFIRGIIIRKMEAHSKTMAAHIKSKLRLLIFDKILRLGPGYVGNKRSGEISSLALDGIESLEPFLVDYIPQIVTVSVSGIAVGAYLCWLDPITGFIIVTSMILCVVIPYLTIPLINKNIVSYWKGYSVLTAQYVDTIQGMTTLKALNAARERGMELEKDTTLFYEQAIRNTGISLLNSGMMLILTSIVSGVTVVIAAFRADIGILPVTAVSVFLFLAAECARPMVELNRNWHSSFLGLSVAQDLFELIDTNPIVKENDDADCKHLDKGLPSVNLCDVSFSYKAGTEVLHGVSLSIPSNSTVAIVGRSGSGKSTVLNLLQRFFDVDSGKILINDVNICDYSIEYLQSKIAVVFQETYLFSGTILENIRMARPNALEDDVIKAAKAANAHDFIMAMQNGYNSIVGERGVTLSGGQRQRISIARAILKDAPILLLDEPTSSVDSKSEALILDALDDLTKNCTTIIVAHRLSTIQNADKIFVLDNGKLAEQGTHKQLLSMNGIYSALINAQQEGTT